VEKNPCVYMLASGFNGTLYTGVTSDLAGRLFKHREGLTTGFVDRYDVRRLVWFEMHHDMTGAITREKTLKKWRREWKIALVVCENATWRDLAEDFGFDRLSRKVDPGSSPG
jgi:putative endonuclease